MTEPVPITVAPPRQPMLLIAGLGALVILLGVVLLVVLRNGSQRDARIGQLACQVERLGGKPLGAKCPPSPKPATRRAPVPTSPAVVTVRPRRTTAAPASARSSQVVLRPAPRSSPARPSPKPSSSPKPRPSPTPTCLRIPPVPLAVCS